MQKLVRRCSRACRAGAGAGFGSQSSSRPDTATPIVHYRHTVWTGEGRGSWAARMHKVRPGERWPSHECGSWIYDSLACRPALCVHVVSPHPFGPSSMRLPHAAYIGLELPTLMVIQPRRERPLWRRPLARCEATVSTCGARRFSFGWQRGCVCGLSGVLSREPAA